MSLSGLGQLDTLPPLPYVAHEILIAVNQQDSNMGDIAQTLSREPGLTARIVSMANSAFFAGQRPVYSAEDAVVRLGLNRVRVLAASILLAKQFDASRCRSFRAEDYWYQAVGTAFTAARLARYARLEASDDAAYLAGLLHNIGLLLLVYVFPREMEPVFAALDEDPEQSLAALTRQAVGTDHAEAGRLLLAEWGLPEEVVVVAGAVHQDSYRGAHAPLVQLIRFCSEWTADEFGDTEPPAVTPGLAADRLASIADSCRRERDQLEAFARLLATG